jgi:hypothetical protein
MSTVTSIPDPADYDSNMAAERETYRIHEDNLAAIHRRLERLNASARRLGLLPVTIEVVASEQVEDDRGWFTTWHNVAIEGHIAPLADWTPLAHIDRGENDDDGEAIVTSIDRSVPVNPTWRTLSRCDHCGHNRRRRYLWVLRHADDGERMIGSTCVADYLGIADAQALASWLDGLSSLLDDLDSQGDYAVPASSRRVRTVVYVGWVVRSVDMRGFHTTTAERSTRDDAWGLFSDRKQPPLTDDEFARAETLSAWALEQAEGNPGNDYLQNLAAAVRRDAVAPNTAGLLASLPGAFDRDRQRKAERAARPQTASGFLADVGAKVHEVTATVTGVEEVDGYMYGTTNDRFRLVTTDGHLVSWDTSSTNVPAEGDRIVIERATVKKHLVTRRGHDLTIVTRAKWSPAATDDTPPTAPTPVETPVGDVQDDDDIDLSAWLANA